MSESARVLEARGLTLAYGDHTIISGLDWTVHAGEVWFLIGPNGSGKTTLLRAILGLLAPRAGELHRDPETASAATLGYVPQTCEINPTLPTTVREFVSLGFVGCPVARSERPARLRWALERVGLADEPETAFGALSGGQRQRALLARALVRRPTLLILDEPTEGLDVSTQDALLQTLDALREEHPLTLLVVTHRLDIAAQRASHVALFHQGRVRTGLRDEVLSEESVRHAFARVELALS